MKEWSFSVILCVFIFIAGLIILVAGGASTKDIATGVGAFLWGTTVPVASWGFRDKIKLGRIARILHLHDPLLGSPSWIDDGKIRHYEFRSLAPSIDTILQLKNLKRVDILSISAYILTLLHNDSIKKSLDRGVVLNFLILDPESEHVVQQCKNYPSARDLKKQITDALDVLWSDKQQSNGENISIRLYNAIIPSGIMVVHLDNDMWVRSENYVVNSDPNSRPSLAAYEKDNKDFCDYHKGNHERIYKESLDYEHKK